MVGIIFFSDTVLMVNQSGNFTHRLTVKREIDEGPDLPGITGTTDGIRFVYSRDKTAFSESEKRGSLYIYLHMVCVQEQKAEVGYSS